jgi:hypothetical protein
MTGLSVDHTPREMVRSLLLFFWTRKWSRFVLSPDFSSKKRNIAASKTKEKKKNITEQMAIFYGWVRRIST